MKSVFMKIIVDECYELNGDYQNQFLGKEVFPKPKYTKLKPAERTVHSVHYEDVYILEPLHYYYVTLNDEVKGLNNFFKIQNPFLENGLIIEISIKENKIYLFNASQNIIYLQKGSTIGEVVLNGWKPTSVKDFKWYCWNYF